MRDIHIAHLDKARPVLVLTREPVRAAMRRVTVAPITSTAKGLSTEVAVGVANGLEQPSVVSCDNIITIDKAALGRHVGFLFEHQEADLAGAIASAFALRVDT
ncbi:type II toxin-antitoxin system PemK/MazF family toxin [Nocardioides humilatus]|uniref:Type II toxin-antitoxin system PemK/MazF family toxin n=1 Tax=Nocardioides humilatus TaxID=2607660 RepID=A0A5B1L5Y6_9ACTN|nr:type II toxin-antitoxin system PemK/MazF family toxin [Nocardioides humilatus]KAA1415925.1 type II toxin-antitoxin system PemK/MazF family toxin [Nocardioides humilatus]